MEAARGRLRALSRHLRPSTTSAESIGAPDTEGGPLLTVRVPDSARDAFRRLALERCDFHHSDAPERFADAAASCVRDALSPELRTTIAEFFRTEGPDGPSSLLLENLGVDPNLPLSTEPQEVAEKVLSAPDSSRTTAPEGFRKATFLSEAWAFGMCSLSPWTPFSPLTGAPILSNIVPSIGNQEREANFGTKAPVSDHLLDGAVGRLTEYTFREPAGEVPSRRAVRRSGPGAAARRPDGVRALLPTVRPLRHCHDDAARQSPAGADALARGPRIAARDAPALSKGEPRRRPVQRLNSSGTCGASRTPPWSARRMIRRWS